MYLFILIFFTDPRIIERIFISRKGSVSKTKEKIDYMFTIRTKIPEFTSPRDILHPDIQRVFKAMYAFFYIF